MNHRKVSFAKSFLRVIGFLSLAGFSKDTTIIGVVILVLAEILGVFEELV